MSGTRPDPSEVQAWVDESLARLGIRRTGPLVYEHVRPWSTAARFDTDDGRMWFKAHTPVLAREAAVTRILSRLRPDLLLEVVAADDARCWLVTRDAGRKLRERIPDAAHLHLVEPVLARYADLQRAAVPYADALLAAGALDRRSATLVDQLVAGLDDTSGLGAEELDSEALDSEEMDALRSLAPRLRDLAATVAAVPDSIEHSDLHDGNVFTDGVRTVVADFGDSGVGHPFMSLVVAERSLADRLALRPDGPELARVRAAYLEPWADLAPRAELERVVRDVWPLGLLGRGLTWRALCLGVDDPAMREFDDAWPSYLRELRAALA